MESAEISGQNEFWWEFSNYLGHSPSGRSHRGRFEGAEQ